MMKSKWAAALLVISLACNLLIAGFLLGRTALPGAGGDPTRGFPRWLHTLPEDRRDVLRPIVAEHMRAVRPEMRSLRQHHRALHQAIVAEPFVPESLDAALKHMRAQNSKLQQVSHTAFVAFVSRLSPAERTALATDLGSRRHGHHGPQQMGP